MAINFSEHLYYDETSPTGIRWKNNRYKGKGYTQLHISKDSVAGCINGLGYYQVCIGKVTYLAHRVVFQLMSQNGLPSGESKLMIDHIDGNRANNTFSNLRLVTPSGNQRNKKMASSNSTGVTGVGIMYKKDGNYTYYMAVWRVFGEKHQRQKTFSVAKYGLLPAFHMACMHRKRMIEELNKQGAGYSDKHGL